MLIPLSKNPPVTKQLKINKMFIALAFLCIIIEALPQGSIPHDQLSTREEHELNLPSKNLSGITHNKTHVTFHLEETDPLIDQNSDDWDRQETAPPSVNSEQTTANNGTTIIPSSESSPTDNSEITTEAIQVEEKEKRRYLWSSRVKDGDTSPGYHLGRIVQDIKSDPMHMFLTISLPIAICGIMLALFCIFGLKPDGYLCSKIFSVDCDVLVQKI